MLNKNTYCLPNICSPPMPMWCCMPYRFKPTSSFFLMTELCSGARSRTHALTHSIGLFGPGLNFSDWWKKKKRGKVLRAQSYGQYYSPVYVISQHHCINKINDCKMKPSFSTGCLSLRKPRTHWNVPFNHVQFSNWWSI